MLSLFLCLCAASVSGTIFFPSQACEYTELRTAVAGALRGVNSSGLCVAHGRAGAQDLSAYMSRGGCGTGAAFLAGVPSGITSLKQRVLAIFGTLDGVVGMSSVALVHHRQPSVRLAAIDGASHGSFRDAAAAPVGLDLRASIAPADVHARVAALLQEFAAAGPLHSAPKVEAESRRAVALLSPLVEALRLEGSAVLGPPSCNSDHPTNPACAYPQWPAHSLPPGPAPAPAPPLPADCVCGSPWVEQNAGVAAAMQQSPQPTAVVTSKDAFHDVADVHPFHLPHVFNACVKGQTNCTLNATTVTMPVLKAGNLFPSTAPLSAFELKTKFKSRVALWEAAGLGKQPAELDKNMTVCRAINQLAYDWALQHADPTVRARFLKAGEPMVMVDDKPAPIGPSGPEWIKDELVYTRVAAAGASHISVQSWQFVVDNVDDGHVPWFLPVGMHYCKLLSPARAMEWIYTDSLRARLGNHH